MSKQELDLIQFAAGVMFLISLIASVRFDTY